MRPVFQQGSKVNKDHSQFLVLVSSQIPCGHIMQAFFKPQVYSRMDGLRDLCAKVGRVHPLTRSGRVSFVLDFSTRLLMRARLHCPPQINDTERDIHWIYKNEVLRVIPPGDGRTGFHGLYQQYRLIIDKSRRHYFPAACFKVISLLPPLSNSRAPSSILYLTRPA